MSFNYREAVDAYVGREVDYNSEVIICQDWDGDSDPDGFCIEEWNIVSPTKPTYQQLLDLWNTLDHTLWSNYPDSYVYATGTSQSIQSRVFTSVNFTEVEDKDVEFVTNTFTSKKVQFVAVNFVGTLNNVSSNYKFEVTIKKNGNIIDFDSNVSMAGLLSTEDLLTSCNVITRLSKGDTLTAEVYNSSLSTLNLTDYRLEILTVEGRGL